jgi:hypothetical protein
MEIKKYKHIKVEAEVWQELRIMAINENIPLQSAVTEILKIFLSCQKRKKEKLVEKKD